MSLSPPEGLPYKVCHNCVGKSSVFGIVCGIGKSDMTDAYLEISSVSSNIYTVSLLHNAQIRTLYIVRNVFAVTKEIEPEKT